MADTPQQKADHGGGIDAAVAQFGGTRAGWVDLSTGINPTPYSLGPLGPDLWNTLPDEGAFLRLEQAARSFWNVPQSAAVLPAPGASALIARMPSTAPIGAVHIPAPTYNEHARAFTAQGWTADANAQTRVLVHPNNPDGRLWKTSDFAPLTIIDESFCDVTPDATLIEHAARPNTIILKSFGKFWGLAGLRLGFAIGDPDLIAKLAHSIGPWAVSGPALEIGARALHDHDWASATRARLIEDAKRLDNMMGLPVVGGTSLFRLYDTEDASALQTHLARAHIWTRVFPYSSRWLRLGLPGTPDHWARLQTAMAQL
jgi:cobalamin biosynthetic protein CobC